MGVFDESNMVKMEFEVIMGLYGKGACLIKLISNVIGNVGLCNYTSNNVMGQ